MIPKGCKRLAEADFPIAEVSRHAAREKSGPKGHPSMLHLWWARRPLGSSRAVLLALLWPDPCDPLCPAEFKAEARKRLPSVGGCHPGTTDDDLRRALLRFIAGFANWDLAADRSYLEASRALVEAAHAPEDGSGPYEPPLVVDPFSGGGSIPLEALRVGCDAFASDLNPVACLILKVMLEDIPRHVPELSDDLRRAGAEIQRAAQKDLADLYPRDPDGAPPIAYLWARTVRCESPNCGAEIPLARSFWLCRKASRRRALRHRVERPKGEPPRVEFEVFEPKTEKDVPNGTVTRAKATCVCCGVVLPPERVRAQLAAQCGGADVVFDANVRRAGGARLLAVVTLRPGETGRHYRLPVDRDYEAVRKAQTRVSKLLDEWERGGRQGPCPVPNEPTPAGGGQGAGRAFSVQRYGMLQWGDLFTARQKVALVHLARSVAADRKHSQVLGCAFNRVTMSDMSCTRWNASAEKMQHTFGRQALPWGRAPPPLRGGHGRAPPARGAGGRDAPGAHRRRGAVGSGGGGRGARGARRRPVPGGLDVLRAGELERPAGGVRGGRGDRVVGAGGREVGPGGLRGHGKERHGEAPEHDARRLALVLRAHGPPDPRARGDRRVAAGPAGEARGPGRARRRPLRGRERLARPRVAVVGDLTGDSVVSRVRSDAWRRVRALRLRALADAPDAFGTTLAEDEARPEASWRARLDDPACATFLAKDEGRDVGVVFAAPFEGRGGAGLFGLWVAPEARGTGVGEALVREVVAWARAAGHGRLALDVGDANAPAIALYARTGFVPTGRTGTLPPPRTHVTEHERALDLI
jgi:GNAT superfamily N-acetyltransferase